MEEALLSSPDPLNDSPTFQSPPKARRSSRARRSLPLRSSSPTKQTFELDVGNRLSPQKLLVTVEAGSDGGDTYNHFVEGQPSSPSRAPVNRRGERTTTTTIPLKGLSDSEDEVQEALTPKRGRGRPKKSIGTPVQNKKGPSSTPVRKNSRKKSIGDLVDGDDEKDVDFQIGKGVEIGRGKGRSRSRSTKGVSRKSTPAPKITEPERVVSSTASKKGRGGRKTLVPEEVVVLEDTSSSSNNCDALDPVDTSGTLQPIDIDEPQSAYSTVRSTTTVGWGEPDVVARFDPRNETPRQTGWSSPRMVERSSSPTKKVTSYPSPSVSPEKSRLSQYGEDSITIVPLTPSETHEEHGDSDEQECEGYEDEDGVGELREFDTFLESEGFSMISVDSVPSLMEHLSSPENQEEKASAKPTRNKSIEAVRDTTAYDDSFSSIFGEVFEATTPARKTQSQNLLSVPASHADDSFSSVPPEILEAATPARKVLVSRLQSSKAPNEDSFSSIALDVLDAATPGRALSKKPLRSLHSEAYKDSFSAIPSAALDAATPAAKRTGLFKPNGGGSEKLTIPGPGLSVSPSHSAIARLPTPEETPSPGDEPVNGDSGTGRKDLMPLPSTLLRERTSSNVSSLMHSHMPSSPPVAPRRYTYTAHLRRRSQLQPDITQTPSIVFSSPILPPPINAPRGQSTSFAPSNLRPALSPVARAGQALQNIVVPSSPRNRSHSLGSPFKSPAAEPKSSSSAVREPYPSPSQERGIKNLPRLDLNGNLSSSSHGLTRSVRYDDPFGNNAPIQQRSPSPEEKQEYSLGLPGKRRLSDPRLCTIRSTADSIRSEDAMSWQAEEETSLPQSTSQQYLSPAEQRWAAERAAVSEQIASADPKQIIIIDSDNGSANNGPAEEEEDFGLLLETLNSSSPAAPEAREQPRDTFEKHRRSKIPSPWRKTSKRLVYSDEISHFSSPVVARSLAKNFGENTASQSVTVRRIETPELQLSDEVDPNICGWQIPQKSNFNPRPRATGNLDLSALLANSPAKRLPVLTTSSRQSASQLPSTSSGVLAGSSSADLKGRPSNFQPREQKPFAPIAQKAGFNPRSRDSSPIKGSTTFGLFGQIPKTNLLSPDVEPSPTNATEICTPLSPTRTKTLNRQQPQQPGVESSSSTVSYDDSISLSEDTSEKENINLQSRTLKWTESVVLSPIIQTPGPTIIPASPTKSCLRTPLKKPSSGPQLTNTSPSKNVQFVSSSPMPSPSQDLLSPITWSKSHWLLLRGIWHSHQALLETSPSNSNSSSETDSNRKKIKKRRNSTRVISKLVGKKVFSGPDSMRLEQWHLEVVDEFRGKVPGWDEKVIALRLFSLIVGAEHRRLGLEGHGSGCGLGDCV